MAELWHAKSKSKYKGGFKTTNGRKNNTAEYNHDYYVQNRDRILRDKLKKKGYNAFQDWWGLDEKDRLKTADEAKQQADRWREMDTEFGTRLISESIYNDDPKESKRLFDAGIDIRNYGWGYSDRASSEYYKALRQYERTPMAKVEKVVNGVNNIVQDAKWAIEDAGKATMDFVNNVISEADYQLWRVGYYAGKALKKKEK